MNLVADLEQAGYDTWTSDAATEMHGWTMHATDGFTRRVNCAVANGAPDTSPDARTEIDQWLTDRGAALVVRVTPLLSDSTVASVTSEWSYRSVDDTVVMTAPVLTDSHPADVVTSNVNDDDFFELISGLNDRRPSSAPAWRRLLDRVSDRAAGVTIGSVGAGIVVASGRFAAVYSVAVSPQARRAGVARRLMIGATNWAADQGCDTMFLQVLGTNSGALALYDTIGYAAVYRYQYLEPIGENFDASIDGC